MSFKREGDDWSQLNVLKVSARAERLEQLPPPSAGREGGGGRCLVALATAGVGREGVRLACDPSSI